MSKSVPIIGVCESELRVARAGEPGFRAPFETAEDFTAAFRAVVKRFHTHEFVFALPLDGVLLDVVKTPVATRETRDEAVAEKLDRKSPFPDEMLVTSAETVAESDTEITSIVAALPEASRQLLDEALAAARVRAVKTDVLAFGWHRTLWPKIGTEGRKLVVFYLDGGYDLLLLDGGALVAARGIGVPSAPAAFSREVMLTALRGGMPADIAEVVVFSFEPVSAEIRAALGAFGPVREEHVSDSYGGVQGVALRDAEGATLDITPESWSEALTESRFTRSLRTYLVAAGLVWVAALGVLFGVPALYGFKTDAEKEICRRHRKQYEAVKTMKERVDLVQRYSDHNRGALEILKAVSDRLPTGVTLTQFSYQTLEKLNLAGESEERQPVLEFKDALVATEVFASVDLKGPNQNRNGQWKFSIEATFEKEEEK